MSEHGVYLHGLPYFIAAEAQTHIPFLIWLSDSYITDNRINLKQLKQQSDIEYTHDNLAHTLLSLFTVRTDLYNQEMDVIHNAKKQKSPSFNTAMHIELLIRNKEQVQ